MSNSHSICFQAGPYSRWTLSMNGFDNDDSGQPARLLVQLSTPTAHGRCNEGHGTLWFGPGTPGYAVMLAALNGMGREPFEKALTWILDRTAERLGDDDTIDPNLRDHWQPIVDAGLAARVEYEEKWGNEREPAFLAIGQIVAVITGEGAAEDCDECGNAIPTAESDEVNRFHAESCSLHPANVAEVAVALGGKR